ncbi:hypothetical protein [Ottowia sp.]|uniref:hypothetical protein n=1 Tax=Ottowia sp. TaxID=1898956 RepID=UPI003A8889C4
MGMTISMALTWILFLGLFPMAFFWLRRAWRILVRHDYSEVALKGGEPPPEPQRYAGMAGAINLIAGAAAVIAIIGVVGFQWPYDTWTAVAGSTIWCKLMADFGLSRHAHLKARLARRASSNQEA